MPTTYYLCCCCYYTYYHLFHHGYCYSYSVLAMLFVLLLLLLLLLRLLRIAVYNPLSLYDMYSRNRITFLWYESQIVTISCYCWLLQLIWCACFSMIILHEIVAYAVWTYSFEAPKIVRAWRSLNCSPQIRLTQWYNAFSKPSHEIGLFWPTPQLIWAIGAIWDVIVKPVWPWTWPCGSAKRKASLWEVNQALVPITSIRQTKARSEVTHWQSTNPRTTPGLSVCFRFGLDMFHYLGCFWCITLCKSLALWQLVKPSKSLWIQNNMMYCHIYVVYVFLFDYLEAWKSTYARSVRLKDNTVGCRLDLRQNYSIVVYWLNWMLYFIVCLIYNHTFTLYTILLKWFIFFQCFIL